MTSPHRLGAILRCALVVALSLACVSRCAGDFPTIVNTTSPLTLAIDPACGSLDAENFTELNTGVVLEGTTTIVAFGDSWTSNGANGTVPVPPIMWPPSPSAGAQFTENRRASNGFIWVENLANSLSAKLLNYAWGGAVIDILAYNSTKNTSGTPSARTDFNDETRLFLLQGKFLDALVPNTTIYTVAFGINDNGQFSLAGGDMNISYSTYVGRLGDIQAAGAKNIVVHGMYTSHDETDLLQTRVFAYLRESHARNGTNFAFVNLQRLFQGILDDPSSFGYTGAGNSTCLVSATSSVGGCDDPDTEVFYIPGHPSLTTHKLISDYTVRVIDKCRLG
ncbi:carbohydrate esterase family 16 protein [Plicaturopsis crispa FD-325 SS-3]|uniref:Carbohydrate esterase family 16 protein n=1 Tax=Plicaturopsis crispa FD-325 SS-3 TaxID=944288 RepID=A0A0C9SKR5_PLICR|nr:carbohydrate esterase family 16 protein [Plicaturopsis crispa FD-325 SS-3]